MHFDLEISSKRFTWNNLQVFLIQTFQILYVFYINPHMVLNKSTSCLGFDRPSQLLLTLGFNCSKADSSLFICRNGTDLTLLLVYVDDVVITGSITSCIQQLIYNLGQEFALKRPWTITLHPWACS